jgi:hypothetical protein
MAQRSAKKNPFSLAERQDGVDHPVTAREWTDAEISEKLEGYVEVRPEFWKVIRSGTHIRYRTKEGKFRVGGFVARNPQDILLKGADTPMRVIVLRNSPIKTVQSHEWTVAYEKTAAVYVKPDAVGITILHSLETSVIKFNDNIKKIAEYAKRLEQRLEAVEKEKKALEQRIERLEKG